MINKVHKFKDKADWLKFRGKGIGGSSISTILGINPYQSRYDLWLQITGREEPPVVNNHMMAGIFLEDGVANWFQHETGHHVVKASAENLIMEHPKYPFIKASPDRKVFLNKSRKHNDTAIMEIKTTGLTIDPDDVPMTFYIQGMFYAGFWEYPKVIVCWYSRFTNTINYKEYDFNQELFDMIIDQAVSFWNDYILTDKPPPAETASDINTLYPNHEEDKMIVASTEVEKLYSNAIAVHRRKKEITEEYTAITDKVKVIMKDAEKLVDQQLNTLFTFRTGKRGRTLKIKEI